MAQCGQTGWHKPARLESPLSFAMFLVVKNAVRLDPAILRAYHLGNIHYFARTV